MHTFDNLGALREFVSNARRQGKKIGFVPTMGNLHAGHFALVKLAKQHADVVVSSIFVNPTQFGPNEDYSTYPRSPQKDADGLQREGCDALFLPDTETMYPFGTAGCVQMHVPGITDILCGVHRPGHFNGVATVVARLFNMVQPDIAVFGRKDYQQLQVIRYMAKELAFPIEIIPAPTLRDPDGLAMSSRNQYLQTDQRKTAAQIYQTLLQMREQSRKGEGVQAIELAARQRLEVLGYKVDYAEIRRADLSRPQTANETQLLALIAARLGRTRLIDNLEFDVA
jgi:pantoate--beta-alanine ligase